MRPLLKNCVYYSLFSKYFKFEIKKGGKKIEFEIKN